MPVYFNPRTREGCDFIFSYLLLPSTYFNPRTREGCDRRLLHVVMHESYISIHAPVKGATDKWSIT